MLQGERPLPWTEENPISGTPKAYLTAYAESENDLKMLGEKANTLYWATQGLVKARNTFEAAEKQLIAATEDFKQAKNDLGIS